MGAVMVGVGRGLGCDFGLRKSKLYGEGPASFVAFPYFRLVG